MTGALWKLLWRIFGAVAVSRYLDSYPKSPCFPGCAEIRSALAGIFSYWSWYPDIGDRGRPGHAMSR
jgi:hypothetical protein